MKVTDSTDNSKKGMLARQVRPYYLNSRQSHRWGKPDPEPEEKLLVNTQTFLSHQKQAISLQGKVPNRKRKPSI